jgi:DNA-binding NarL/FixJ family response regulator
MSSRIPVFVYAEDPVSQAGIAAALRARTEVVVVDDGDVDAALVAVVVVDRVDDDAVRVMRAIQRNGCPRIVLVATAVDEQSLVIAAEAGACAILRRGEATAQSLVDAVMASTRGDGTLPPDLLARLLSQVGDLQRRVLAPRGLTVSGLTERETGVLRLLAEGCSTAEIATELSYSERTIKNVIHDVTTKLNLRNRSHAVAYAVRQGLI